MPSVPPPAPGSGKHYNLDNVLTVHTSLSVTKILMAKIDADADAQKVSRAHVIHDIIERYYDCNPA